jgi:hypothetical protein
MWLVIWFEENPTHITKKRFYFPPFLKSSMNLMKQFKINHLRRHKFVNENVLIKGFSEICHIIYWSKYNVMVV